MKKEEFTRLIELGEYKKVMLYLDVVNNLIYFYINGDQYGTYSKQSAKNKITRLLKNS